jgi:hypothetical protein
MNAASEELVGIARAIGATETGALQVVSDFEGEIETFFAMMRASSRPLSSSLTQTSKGDSYRRTLRAVEAANKEGLEMTVVTTVRAIGRVMTLEGTKNPWAESQTFQSAPALRDPDVKQRIIAETIERGGSPIPLSSSMSSVTRRTMSRRRRPRSQQGPASSVEHRRFSSMTSSSKVLPFSRL